MLLLTSLAAILLSCGRPAPRLRPASSYTGPLNATSIEGMVHDLVNRQRRKKGLGSLKLDKKLSGIARAHSRDMATRGYFSHYSPDGKDFSSRYDAGGFECKVHVGQTIYLGAENIFNVMFTGNMTGARIANDTVNGWMKSPGHRKNILTPHWGLEGIGVSIGRDGGMVVVYITQNFC